MDVLYVVWRRLSLNLIKLLTPQTNYGADGGREFGGACR